MATNVIIGDGGIFPRGFSVNTDFLFPLRRADELVELCYGKALREPDRIDGNVPVYGTNGRCGWHNSPLADGPGVILGRKGMGPLGVEWSSTGFWVIDTAYFVRPKTREIDLEYFYYLVKYIGLNHLKDGTSNPSLSRHTFGALLIPIPPVSAQRRIAESLRTLDDKIELNRRMNETLEGMARALFKSWFVDFDPVRAKLDGRQPPGLDAAMAALFPDRFEHGELGMVPEGWRVRPVGEIVEAVGGGTPSTKEPLFWEGGIHHWTTPKDLSNLAAPILLDTSRKVTDAGLEKISSGLLPQGTLLLSSRAPVGYLAISEIPVAVNQGFIAMKCEKGISNFFMLNWCRENLDEIERRASGTTFQEISKRNFRPIPIATPSVLLVAAFGKAVGPLYRRITSNLRESQSLAAIRDTLLPKLLSGEIRVSDCESLEEMASCPKSI